MRKLLFVTALLMSGCSTLDNSPGLVMSADHRTGKVRFEPAKLLYFPEDALPRKKEIDYSLTMCIIYG